MCKVYTGYCGTSEIEHELCACTVDNPLAKARGLSLRTGAQTILYLSLVLVLGKLLWRKFPNIFFFQLHSQNLTLAILCIFEYMAIAFSCLYLLLRSGVHTGTL